MFVASRWPPSSGPRPETVSVVGSVASADVAAAVLAQVSQLQPASMARAYLIARRRQPVGKIQVPVVLDKNNMPVDFGLPCDWASGTASGVLRGDYHVNYVEYNNVPEPPSQAAAGAGANGPAVSDKDWSALDSSIMDGLVFGAAANIGPRSQMEDDHIVLPNFTISSSTRSLRDQNRFAYVGVYDGHGGKEAVKYCKDKLHVNIAQCIRSVDRKDISRALTEGTLLTERNFFSLPEDQTNFSGAVTISCVINGAQFWVANCGDSRAVLCRNGTALDLTTDHTPAVFDEKMRVEAEGGFIEAKLLNGEIAVTRALGDRDPETHQKIKGLSAVPEVREYFVRDEDEFIIIACDGLWNVMQSEEAVSFARLSLQNLNDVQKTCEDLVHEALRKNSEDNVTVVIVGFSRVDPEEGDRKVVRPRAGRRRQSIHPQAMAPAPERSSTRPKLRPEGLKKAFEALKNSVRSGSSP